MNVCSWLRSGNQRSRLETVPFSAKVECNIANGLRIHLGDVLIRNKGRESNEDSFHGNITPIHK